MKRKIFLAIYSVILFVLLIIFFNYRDDEVIIEPLQCNCSQEHLQNEIAKLLQADSVVIKKKNNLRHRGQYVEIYNATVDSFDFKTLPMEFEPIDNIYKVIDFLLLSALDAFNLLKNNCDIKDKYLIFEYRKLNQDNKLIYVIPIYFKTEYPYINLHYKNSEGDDFVEDLISNISNSEEHDTIK